MKEEIIDGKIYREITLRGRTKLIARDGSAVNPSRRNQQVTYHINKDGYPCYGGGVPIHMYVAHAWVDGYFEGAEINHKDFNRMNYDADNLEWVTHADNVRYSRDNNPEWNESRQGIHNGRATFTEDEVIKIRELYDDGMAVADILRLDYPEMIHSKDYKSLHSTYLNICQRKTWKHLK